MEELRASPNITQLTCGDFRIHTQTVPPGTQALNYLPSAKSLLCAAHLHCEHKEWPWVLMDPRDSPREGHLCGGGGGGWPSCTACCVQQGVPPALHPEQTWAAPTSVRRVLTWSSFMLLTSSSACICQSLHRGRAEKNQVARTSPRARSLLRPVRVRVRVRVSEPEATWLRPPTPPPSAGQTLT